MRRFTFLKGAGRSTNGGCATGTMEDIKNSSLPKTASTINPNRTQTTLECESNRKQVSK